MSKSAVVLNGENTSEVGDFTTDANVNMVADINDHSCTKHLESFNSKDNKTGILAFPCDFDHMYASKMTDNVNIPGSNPEINHLKELLLLHLDLIQQQSEQLVTKDKQITALKQETEMLKQRLERMDRRVTLHKQKELSEVPVTPLHPLAPSFSNTTPAVGEIPLPPHPPPPSILPTPSTPTASSVPLTTPLATPVVENNRQNLEPDTSVVEVDNVTPIVQCKRRRDDGTSSSLIFNMGTVSVSKRNSTNSSVVFSEGAVTVSKRNRSASWGSSVPMTELMTPVSKVNGRGIRSESLLHKDGRRKRRGRRPKIVANEAALPKKEEPILMTDKPYFTPVGEDNTAWCMEEPQINGHFLEVPSWRVKAFTSCYTMEGTENLSDDVFDRRHSRLEIDERRRKRWDVQRIREQRQVEKLKQRQRRRNSSNVSGLVSVSVSAASPVVVESDDEELVSLWPAPEEAEYLVVEDTLPVSAFGYPITKFGSVDTPTEFTLPWMNGKETPRARSANKARRKR